MSAFWDQAKGHNNGRWAHVNTKLLHLYFLPSISEQVKNVTTVPTLQFVLFLFMQHLHKINLRSSLVSPTEEYPF